MRLKERSFRILRRNKLSFAFFLALLSTNAALAQISVNTVILHFKAGQRPIQNLIVHNSAEQVLYVTVSSEEFTLPGEEKSPLVATEALLISPKRFTVDAKNERVIRLLNKKAPDENEHVYRIAFVPQDRGFAASVENTHEGRKTMLRVLTGMGVLVFVDPVVVRPGLKWERLKGKIRFWNEGNVHTRLTEGKACNADGTACTELPSRRVYANREFVVEIPDEKTATFTKRDGASGKFETLVVPPNQSATNK